MSIKRITLALAVAAVVVLAGGAGYYEYAGGSACARCHEIQASYDNWHSSTHRKMACSSCHGSALTFDVKFHLANFRRVVQHLRGAQTEKIHLKHTDLYPVVERCQKCHQQEFAAWQAGPHGTTYARIFLDRKHNTKERLMDDCLRCHGMHFEGGIRDLVTPVSTKGPWTLKQPGLAQRAAIPCMSCHEMHRQGQPLERPAVWTSPAGPKQEISRPSLSLYDRREQSYVSTRLLPLPQMVDNGRPVKMSPDQRQSLCYQCHAPIAGSMQVGSGDDRTAAGVHEGLSCLACHFQHGEQTRASCANCHPRLSNCGLDVEKMDTTFKDVKSRHNVHWVKCQDCHEKGIPKRKTPAGRALAQAD